MNLEEIAKKAYPYTLLGTTAGLVWLANNPLEAVYFYNQNEDEAFNFFVNCNKYYAPLAIATGFYIVSKLKNSKTTFLEPIVKNKYTFMNMQNIIGAAFIGLASSQRYWSKDFANLCYTGAFVNIAYTHVFKILIDMLQMAKPPHFLNTLHLFNTSIDLLFEKKDDPEKLEEKIEKFNSFRSENENPSLFILSMIHSENNKQKAIEDALSKIDIPKKSYEKRNTLTFIANSPNELLPYLLRFFPKSNNVLNGKEFFWRLNLSEFMSCYEREIEKTNSPEAQLLYSLFLDRLAKDKDEVDAKISISRRWRAMRKLRKEFGEGTLKELIEAKANKEWQKVVERIVKDERFEATQESIEGKRVFSAGVYPILKTTIVVKEDERNVLESELENLNYLREKIKGTDFEAANALRIMDVNGKSLLVERHSSGRRLTEILEQQEDFELISKVVQYLKLIHDKMPVPKIVVNPEEELLSILRKAELDNKTKQIIYDGIKVTLPNLSTRRVFDADAHADNWFIAGERIIAIDKPTRKAIPPEYDLNKLLNRGKEISAKENLIKIYSPEDEFLFSFYNATAIKALSYFVFTQSYKEKAEQGKQYLENAMKDLEVLKERYSGRFSRENVRKLDNLSEMFINITV